MAEITQKNIFEMISVYFVNRYWNLLYQTAIDFVKEERYPNIEESYKNTISKYGKAFSAPDERNDSNKHYRSIMENMHKYFQNYFVIGSTYFEFIDILCRYFIPEEYYQSLSIRDPRKDNIARKVLSKTVMSFTVSMVQGDFKLVIDTNTRANMNCMNNVKQKFMEILITERNELSAFLLAESSGVDLKKEDAPKISKELCDMLQNKIRILINEKNQFLKERNQYAKYANALKDIVEDREREIADLLDELNGFKEEEHRGRKKHRRHDNNSSNRTADSHQDYQIESKILGNTQNTSQNTSSQNQSSQTQSSQKKELLNPALEEMKRKEYHEDIIELPDDEFRPDD